MLIRPLKHFTYWYLNMLPTKCRLIFWREIHIFPVSFAFRMDFPATQWCVCICAMRGALFFPSFSVVNVAKKKKHEIVDNLHDKSSTFQFCRAQLSCTHARTHREREGESPHVNVPTSTFVYNGWLDGMEAKGIVYGSIGMLKRRSLKHWDSNGNNTTNNNSKAKTIVSSSVHVRQSMEWVRPARTSITISQSRFFIFYTAFTL